MNKNGIGRCNSANNHMNINRKTMTLGLGKKRYCFAITINSILVQLKRCFVSKTFKQMILFSFQYICRQFEMVLADGSRVVCSPTEHQELFAATPFSYGTLGFLMSVDIDIIPYKPYIK